MSKFEWGGAFAAAVKPKAARGPRAARVGKTVLKPTRGDAATFGRVGDDGRPPVLIINSYAGSLVQAAKTAQFDVIGSYEHDGAYGLDVQQLNFPELEGLWAGDRAGWRDDWSLENCIVIAHPPCAPFSMLNNKNKKNPASCGADAKKFEATKDVVEYALGRRAMALLLESVPGALEGARAVHDEFAVRFGYNIYRVLQNACTFGLAQWRPRYWTAYVREGLVRKDEPLPFIHVPTFATFSSIMKDDSTPFEDHVAKTDAQVLLLRNLTKLTAQDVLYTNQDGRMPHVLMHLGIPHDEAVKLSTDCGKFESRSMMLIERDAVAPTLVSNSWNWSEGRLANRKDYNALMGFPRDYVFPAKTKPVEVRGLLSRGVCPPVARWLLEEVSHAVTRDRELPSNGVVWCEPGGIADFQPPVKQRKGLTQFMPELCS